MANQTSLARLELLHAGVVFAYELILFVWWFFLIYDI